MNDQDDRQRLLDEIMRRASEDTSFRTFLLSEPKEAIYQTFGVRVPLNFRVQFIEKGADIDALVVLPDMARTNDELTDDDLDAVAGGTGNPPPGTW